MKLLELKCKNCDAALTVKPNTTDIRCTHCKASYKLDDEVQHIKFDDMEKAGYDYERGKQKAAAFLLGITEKYRKQDMSSFVISSQCNNCMAYQAKYKRKTATAK